MSRVGAAVVGGYAFTWGFATMVIAIAVALGLPFGGAQTLANLLAFLVFVAGLCWAISTPRVTSAWAVLAGGGLLTSVAGWLLLQHLAA